jgi:DNA-binding CsgD family transcriptional regulator
MNQTWDSIVLPAYSSKHDGMRHASHFLSGTDAPAARPRAVLESVQRQQPRGASRAVLRALGAFVDPIAAFCVLWPSDFSYVTACPVSDGPTGEEVFAVSRERLIEAFALASPEESVPVGGTSARAAGPWRVERLPLSLQRPPFLVPGVTKLTLPFHVDGCLAGFAGLALPRDLDGADYAWYAGCCVALAQSIAAVGTATGEEGASLAPGGEMQAVEGHSSDTSGASAPPASPLRSQLSAREFEIAQYLSEGHSTINVAAILGLSTNTVRTYVRRIYSKLNVCSRVELTHRMCD